MLLYLLSAALALAFTIMMGMAWIGIKWERLVSGDGLTQGGAEASGALFCYLLESSGEELWTMEAGGDQRK